jgi:hypothetical protein
MRSKPFNYIIIICCNSRTSHKYLKCEGAPLKGILTSSKSFQVNNTSQRAEEISVVRKYLLVESNRCDGSVAAGKNDNEY